MQRSRTAEIDAFIACNMKRNTSFRLVTKTNLWITYLTTPYLPTLEPPPGSKKQQWLLHTLLWLGFRLARRGLASRLAWRGLAIFTTGALRPSAPPHRSWATRISKSRNCIINISPSNIEQRKKLEKMLDSNICL